MPNISWNITTKVEDIFWFWLFLSIRHVGSRTEEGSKIFFNVQELNETPLHLKAPAHIQHKDLSNYCIYCQLYGITLLMRFQWFPNHTQPSTEKQQDYSKTFHNANCRPYWFWFSFLIRVGNILMMGKAFGMLYEMKDPHQCEIQSMQQKEIPTS